MHLYENCNMIVPISFKINLIKNEYIFPGYGTYTVKIKHILKLYSICILIKIFFSLQFCGIQFCEFKSTNKSCLHMLSAYVLV